MVDWEKRIRKSDVVAFWYAALFCFTLAVAWKGLQRNWLHLRGWEFARDIRAQLPFAYWQTLTLPHGLHSPTCFTAQTPTISHPNLISILAKWTQLALCYEAEPSWQQLMVKTFPRIYKLNIYFKCFTLYQNSSSKNFSIQTFLNWQSMAAFNWWAHCGTLWLTVNVGHCWGEELTLVKVSRTHQQGSSSWILLVAMATVENPESKKRLHSTAADCRVGTEERDEGKPTHIKTYFVGGGNAIWYWQVNGRAVAAGRMNNQDTQSRLIIDLVTWFNIRTLAASNIGLAKMF